MFLAWHFDGHSPPQSLLRIFLVWFWLPAFRIPDFGLLRTERTPAKCQVEDDRRLGEQEQREVRTGPLECRLDHGGLVENHPHHGIQESGERQEQLALVATRDRRVWENRSEMGRGRHPPIVSAVHCHLGPTRGPRPIFSVDYQVGGIRRSRAKASNSQRRMPSSNVYPSRPSCGIFWSVWCCWAKS